MAKREHLITIGDWTVDPHQFDWLREIMNSELSVYARLVERDRIIAWKLLGEENKQRGDNRGEWINDHFSKIDCQLIALADTMQYRVIMRGCISPEDYTVYLLQFA